MAVKEILAEINSLPRVGGTILCTLNGKILAQELANFTSDYQKGAFSKVILDIYRRFDESGESFIEMPDPQGDTTWIALKYKGIILIVLLYPDADLYLVKLQLNLLAQKVCEEKEIRKILAKEAAILITTIKQIAILDVLQFQEYIKREGFTKGIILTQKPYNERVREELEKPNKKIEVIITDDIKSKRKNLTREYEKQGFAVTHRSFTADRGI